MAEMAGSKRLGLPDYGEPTNADLEGPALSEIARTVEDLRAATAEVRAIGDRVASTLYRLNIEEKWLVPVQHRPSCPLTSRPCSSWSCLVDVCAWPGSGNEREADRG